MPTDMHESLTVVIQTSPIPSHPSTALLKALFRSFVKADGLLESRIVILADGCEQLDTTSSSDKNAIENIKHGKCTSNTAQRYREHLELLERAVRDQIIPFCPLGSGSIELVKLPKRHGSAPAIREAMEKWVTTPLVMICQHDNFFLNTTPLRMLVEALLEEPGLGIGATCIHFLSTATLNYKDKIRKRYQLDLGDPIHVDGLDDPLVPLVFWYGRSHVSYSEYVRSYCLNRELAQGSHLEELLGEAQLHHIRRDGMAAHKIYGTYVLDQGREVLYHMSGRRVRAAAIDEVTNDNALSPIMGPITSTAAATTTILTTPQQPQPLEASYTTARETRAKVPGLSFLVPEEPTVTKQKPTKPFKQRCFHCGEKGHSKKFCPLRIEVASTTSLSTCKPPQAEIIEL